LRSEVRWVADLNEQRLDAVKQRFPAVKVTSKPEEAITDPDVDAVIVATPAVTHYGLVKQALENGKHVLVEKPLTKDGVEGEELVALARSNERILLVGHIFVYNRAVRWVKDYIDSGELGAVYYISSSRTNLGPIRADVNAAWDLASQDLAVFNYWLGATPISVSAIGGNWINEGVEDAVFSTIRYSDKRLCQLHVSWLNPRKVRDITVVAQDRMLTYDDMNLSEPLRIYDKGVLHDENSAQFVDTFGSFRSSIRDGDITIPRVGMGEPLRDECEHFLDCITKGAQPMTGGAEAVAVVKTLEAMDRSMQNSGREEII
jgi:predicted dehydrogenase